MVYQLELVHSWHQVYSAEVVLGVYRHRYSHRCHNERGDIVEIDVIWRAVPACAGVVIDVLRASSVHKCEAGCVSVGNRRVLVQRVARPKRRFPLKHILDIVVDKPHTTLRERLR